MGRYRTWFVAIGAVAFAISADAAPESSRPERIEADVKRLASDIGERNTRKPEALQKTERFVRDRLSETGLKVVREPYVCEGQTVANLYIDVIGTKQPEKWIVIGAHYDSAVNTPGANDNGTGVAALLELAKAIATSPCEKSIRLVAFANEEPPYFQTGAMGSLIHADGCKKRGETIDAMISLETIGCYSDAKNSQHFPPGLRQNFPTTGNFIAVVSNPDSAAMAGSFHGLLKAACKMPAELAILPAQVPGVGWSDHWSFWQHGYPAVMVTDTAPFRFAHYHQPTDTPDKIDFVRVGLVVDGLEVAIDQLASESATTKPAP